MKEVFHWIGHTLEILVIYIIHQERIVLRDVIQGRLERRKQMDLTTILALIEHGIPALEAGWATLESQIPQDKADALAAWQAGLKAFGDIKNGIPVIIAAIKAAANPPAA